MIVASLTWKMSGSCLPWGNSRPRPIDDLKFQVAEREKAERALRELTNAPGSRVRVRTEELEQRNEEVKKLQDQLYKENIALWEEIDNRKRTEQSLRQAQARLSRATQVATAAELPAFIAHEINQPLAAVVAHGHAGLRWLSAIRLSCSRTRNMWRIALACRS
jgi:C4-dicarboxylate-specific signal transduction histidine kinase